MEIIYKPTQAPEVDAHRVLTDGSHKYLGSFCDEESARDFFSDNPRYQPLPMVNS